LRVVVLSWEYPPRRVGAMADQVWLLASQLSNSGIDVDVVTYHESIHGVEHRGGLHIHRVQVPITPCVNIVTWALYFSAELQKVVSEITYSDEGIDLVDAHEWETIPAAVGLKKALGIPFTYTVYSLEDHRSLNPETPLSMCIKGVERLGGYECEMVVARSKAVESDMQRIHKLPPERVQVVSPESPGWIQRTVQVYGRAKQRVG